MRKRYRLAGQLHDDGLNDDEIDEMNLFGSDTSPAGTDGDAAEFEAKLQTWQKLFSDDYAFYPMPDDLLKHEQWAKAEIDKLSLMLDQMFMEGFGHFRLVGRSTHAWTTSHEDGLRARAGLEKSNK